MDEEILKELETALQGSGAALVIKNGGALRCCHGSGIKPLLDILKAEPDFLKGAYVLDKVVGKAAAMLMAYGKIKAVHAVTVSAHAKKALESAGIKFSFDIETPFIQNRALTGMCPMEKLCLDITDPAEGFKILCGAVYKT